MKWSKIISTGLSLILSNTLYSGSMGTTRIWSPVIALSAGPIWNNNAGTTQTFYLQSDVAKTYEATPKNQTLGEGELFLGIQYPFANWLLNQTGFSFTGTGDAFLQGNIWEDADPEFNNYNYKYKLSHLRFVAKTKLIFNLQTIAQPYVSAGLGIALNKAHNFKITPKIFEEVPAPAFTSHTQTAFTYTVGAGIQKTIKTNWQAGVGYEFADWGKNHLGKAPGQTLNQGIKLNHFYTNGLIFSLSYIV